MNTKIKFNQEHMKTMLPYVEGKKTLSQTDIDTASKDKLAVMRVLGLVKMENIKTKKMVPWEGNQNKVLSDSRNFHDFRDQLEAWIEADFEQSLADISHDLMGYILVKCAGDDYGVIVDEEDNTVLYLRHYTDTRCPWVDIPGDTRRMVLGCITMHQPLSDGTWKRMFGWMKNNNRKGKRIMTYKDTGLRVSDFSEVCHFIRTELLGFKISEDSRKPTYEKYSMRVRRQFTLKGLFYSTLKDTINGEELSIEITKDIGSNTGTALVNGVEIAKVEMKDSGGFFRLHVTPVDGFKGNLVDITNACQMAVYSPVEEPSGKSQFQTQE